MTVKRALQLINRELDEYLSGIQGEFDTDTRFAITYFEQSGMAEGELRHLSFTLRYASRE